MSVDLITAEDLNRIEGKIDKLIHLHEKEIIEGRGKIARYIGVSVGTLDNMRRDGRVKIIQAEEGGAMTAYKKDLDSFIESLRGIDIKKQA